MRFAFPKLITIPEIVNNVSKYGGLTIAKFRTAISWGSSPTIVIRDLHHGQCGVPKAYGCFRHANPANIEIHTGTVTDYEKSTKSRLDQNKVGKPVYVVGASMLHELCHWGIPKALEI